MVEYVKFIKDTSAGYKKDDIVRVSDNECKEIISTGFAEKVNMIVEMTTQLNEGKKPHVIEKPDGQSLEVPITVIATSDNIEGNQKQIPKKETEEKPVILDLFEEGTLTQKNDGNFQTACPSCGLQSGRTEGLIIFPENNGWYCHSTGKHGSLLELIAMKHKIIECLDCLDSGEKRRVLESEQFKETMDILELEYSKEIYQKVLNATGIRQKIQLPNDGKLISKFADELAERLKPENIFFNRPELNQIVEIGKIKNSNGEYENTGFIIVTGSRFVTIAERYFMPWTNVYTKFGKMIVTKSMSTSTANLVLVSDNFKDQMPVINRIFRFPMPHIINGNLVFPEKGYDKRFGSWMSHNAPEILNPDMPLEEAKKILYFIYCEFCYLSDQDYTHAIARIITPMCRGLYPRYTCRTPLWFLMANREGAGKDFHEGITSILYEGVAIEEPPIATGEYGASGSNDELRKKLLSAAICGRYKLHFANNKGLIKNSVFEGILTSETFEDRKLGVNDMLTFPNEFEFSLSGNTGISMTPDLYRRTRTINLQLDIEESNKRIFKNPDLHGWVLKNRGLILSAIFSIIKNWFNKGMPKGSIPFASYVEWSHIVGGIMEAAGYDNPCKKEINFDISSIDIETIEMKSLFELCFELSPDTWLEKNDIKIIISNDGSIMPDLDWEKRSDQTKFAIKLQKYVDRVLSDIRLIVENKNIRKERWKYKFTKVISLFDAKKVFGADFEANNDSKNAFSQENGNLTNLGNLLPFGNTPYTTIENITIRKGSHSPRGYQNGRKKDLEKVKKTDRDTQFYVSEETQDIKQNVTPEQILEYLKDTEKVTFQQLYDKFGVGTTKIKNLLVKEGKILQKGGFLCLP